MTADGEPETVRMRVPRANPDVTDAPMLPAAGRWQVDRHAWRMVVGAALLLGVFAVLALLLRHASGTALDVTITRLVQRINDPVIVAFMLAVSAPGYWPWSIVVVGAASLLLTFNRRFVEATFVLLTEGAGALVVQIKPLIERPRPSGESIRIVAAALDYSYPSGHVVGYVALYGFLFFLVYVLYRQSLARSALLSLLGGLVALIGVSRIYLGHHWVSDVLGGYALGTAYLLLLIVLYRLLVSHVGVRRPASAPAGAAAADPGTRPAFGLSHVTRRVRPGSEGV